MYRYSGETTSKTHTTARSGMLWVYLYIVRSSRSRSCQA